MQPDVAAILQSLLRVLHALRVSSFVFLAQMHILFFSSSCFSLSRLALRIFFIFLLLAPQQLSELDDFAAAAAAAVSPGRAATLTLETHTGSSSSSWCSQAPFTFPSLPSSSFLSSASSPLFSPFRGSLWRSLLTTSAQCGNSNRSSSSRLSEKGPSNRETRDDGSRTGRRGGDMSFSRDKNSGICVPRSSSRRPPLGSSYSRRSVRSPNSSSRSSSGRCSDPKAAAAAARGRLHPSHCISEKKSTAFFSPRLFVFRVLPSSPGLLPRYSSSRSVSSVKAFRRLQLQRQQRQHPLLTSSISSSTSGSSSSGRRGGCWGSQWEGSAAAVDDDGSRGGWWSCAAASGDSTAAAAVHETLAGALPREATAGGAAAEAKEMAAANLGGLAATPDAIQEAAAAAMLETFKAEAAATAAGATQAGAAGGREAAAEKVKEGEKDAEEEAVEQQAEEEKREQVDGGAGIGREEEREEEEEREDEEGNEGDAGTEEDEERVVWPATAAPFGGLRRPLWSLDDSGNFQIIERRGPVADERLVGWEDVLLAEEQQQRQRKKQRVESSSSRISGSPTAAAAAGGAAAAAATTSLVETPLTYAEEIQQRLFSARKIPHFLLVHNQPRAKPALWIVRPKQGAYCELMKEDAPRLHSLVSRVRRRFDRNRLDIFNITISADMPLCEVFFIGPTPEIGRIFYARGGTLQYRVRPRFWTTCPLLGKDERLTRKYGGDGCPGLFPQWDEDGIMEEMEEVMNQPSPDTEGYPVFLEWENLGAFTPENVEERPHWYTHVHWPTRVAVQKAFEAGVADFRLIIEEEYRQLQEDDRRKALQQRREWEAEEKTRKGSDLLPQ